MCATRCNRPRKFQCLNFIVLLNLRLDLKFYELEERRCISVPVALQLPSKVLQSRGRKGFGVAEGHLLTL